MKFREITIPYGKSHVNVSIPCSNLIWEKGPKSGSSDPNCIDRALENPVNSLKIQDLARGRNNALIIIDDKTRNTPTDIILPKVINQLKTAGIQDNKIVILIALGTHNEMTKGEIIEKCGRDIFDKYRILQHDYNNYENLSYYGRVDLEIPIWINKIYLESDIKIAIGKIIPHVDVVWSGGAKIIVPGICGKETVEKFHLASTKNKDKLKGKVDNIVRKAMEDIAGRTGLDFILNVIVDENQNLIDAVAGNFVHAHRKGVEIAEKIFTVDKNTQKADLILISSYPADEDFWQAGKAVSAAVPLVKEGGDLVLVSPCYKGFSPDHPVLIESLIKGLEATEKAISEKKTPDIAGAAIAIDVLKIINKNNICLYSRDLDEDLLNRINFQKINNLQEYIDNYIMQNPDCKIGVIYSGTEIMVI
jgi:nickel-dependent lactate racemase